MGTITVQVLAEHARWHARPVKYRRGPWSLIRDEIPEFALTDFSAGPDEPPNPFLQTVLRLPLHSTERPMPVGTVSRTYMLVQHRTLGDLCFDGLKTEGIDVSSLTCEVGLSELGEWMNLRIYFPDRYSYRSRDGQQMRLRVECFNSVDGSSRLIVMLSWLRLICSNGLAVRESLAQIRDIHNKNLDLQKIVYAIRQGIRRAQEDMEYMEALEDEPVDDDSLEKWVNGVLSKRWGKKAACRVFHICRSGYDVEITDAFAAGEATVKPVRPTQEMPGAPQKAKNLYDVTQALSWVATNRSDAEQRLLWQTQIPSLISKLAA